ncbi:hypothetical protein E4U32_007024 [Claviceps aff. humidiphila group G2b]|nr:hypothetical protein E4U32_007024 [Claviceps aff. humidiphila group G2b]
MITERDQHREALAAACDKAFQHFLTEIASNGYQPLLLHPPSFIFICLEDKLHETLRD